MLNFVHIFHSHDVLVIKIVLSVHRCLHMNPEYFLCQMMYMRKC